MILMTGGTVGRQVVGQLLDAGESVRVLVRHPASVDLPAGVEAARGDLATTPRARVADHAADFR